MEKKGGLPQSLQPLFWEYHFNQLEWKKDRDLIIGRILCSGDWGSVEWLRSRLTDEELKQWILDRQGRGLDPKRLRFWELVLGLPHHKVTSWLRSPQRQIWDRRASR